MVLADCPAEAGRRSKRPRQRGPLTGWSVSLPSRSSLSAACFRSPGWRGSGGERIGCQSDREAINRFLGDWALRFLLISLTISPLKEICGWPVVMRFRRMLGLFAFAYVALHLSSWIVLDQFFSWAHIWADIVKRPFITVGMAAFLLLIPLAATSTAAMIKRLGAKRWKRLHMLVYPAAMLGMRALLHDGQGRYPRAADLRHLSSPCCSDGGRRCAGFR